MWSYGTPHTVAHGGPGHACARQRAIAFSARARTRQPPAGHEVKPPWRGMTAMVRENFVKSSAARTSGFWREHAPALRTRPLMLLFSHARKASRQKGLLSQC